MRRQAVYCFIISMAKHVTPVALRDVYSTHGVRFAVSQLYHLHFTANSARSHLSDLISLFTFTRRSDVWHTLLSSPFIDIRQTSLVTNQPTRNNLHCVLRGTTAWPQKRSRSSLVSWPKALSSYSTFMTGRNASSISWQSVSDGLVVRSHGTRIGRGVSTRSTSGAVTVCL